MREFFHNLFVPKESNNHRAKLLHNKILLFVIAIFLLSNFFLSTIKGINPEVLGTSIDISTEKLLLLTNQKRQEEGLPPLVLNDQLSQAARLKGEDMLKKNYWAHNSPDGDTPWVFFKKVGYEYIYAGENLARGFTNSDDIIKAWMASSSHKENILSQNYQEVGFAVSRGNFLGEDTTLVVEMFGNKTPQIAVKQSNNLAKNNIEVPIGPKASTQQSEPLVASVKTKPLVNSGVLSWNISLFILLLFIFIFALDMIIIERKKIIRVVGHNLDHIIFLGALLTIILIFSRGIIL